MARAGQQPPYAGQDGQWEQQAYWDPGQEARVRLSKNLTTEQEMIKLMLPATEVHKSFKSWVTPQMLLVRVCTKHGHKRQRDVRVVCITPTILFLVHPIGEVRRFVKMAQIESAIASEVLVGGRRLPHLLFKCAYPEHDILLTFIPDSRNIDRRESAATVLQRMEQLKQLRGEYFPVLRTQGDLFAQAQLTKFPAYVAPKRRLDRALADAWGGGVQQDPEYGPDGTDPVQYLGTCAGNMGAADPQPVQSGLGSPVSSPQPAAARRLRSGAPSRRVTFDEGGSVSPAAGLHSDGTHRLVAQSPSMGAAPAATINYGPFQPSHPGAGAVHGSPSRRAGGMVVSHRDLMTRDELQTAADLEDYAVEERRRRDAADARKWDGRAVAALRCGSPRPEDLGNLAATRSPRPVPAEHNGHDYGYGAADRAPDPRQQIGFGGYN
eukprot:TRINITY_DN40012_c0_g1_i1.p1 TRINITY_DN40012_c0_g1~~TRINITY_DN40012_c0_g1_i1.p1  ORF type:complete len:451 (+),score=121.72 TRINITY_DN40012_c0_g1_i1:46-1353(+)